MNHRFAFFFLFPSRQVLLPYLRLATDAAFAPLCRTLCTQRQGGNLRARGKSMIIWSCNNLQRAIAHQGNLFLNLARIYKVVMRYFCTLCPHVSDLMTASMNSLHIDQFISPLSRKNMYVTIITRLLKKKAIVFF